MQDDCYLIAAEGWKAETQRIVEKDKKGKEKDKGWVCDLVPKALLIQRYFPTEQAALTALESEIETLAARLAELEEEHGGEEGAFSELEKINRGEVSRRFREIKGDAEAKDEKAVLEEWLAFSEEETEKQRALKQGEAELDLRLLAKYPKLNQVEIQTLVVEDKWLAALAEKNHGEMDCLNQALTQRISELGGRYEIPLSKASSEVAALEGKVNQHLQRMGFAWN